MTYFFIGLIALFVDNVTFLILHKINPSLLLLDTALALAFGFFTSFIANKMVTFKNKEMNHVLKTHVQVLFSLLLLGFNIVFSYFFVRTLSRVFGYVFLFKLMAAGFVMLWNFFISKYAIFRHQY